jgi:hypothetical protein
MGNQKNLQQLILTRIDQGNLPPAGRHELFGRKGDGLPCVCCDRLITPQQIEYDVEFAGDIGTVMPMHAGCYHAWQEVSCSMHFAPRGESMGRNPAASTG